MIFIDVIMRNLYLIFIGSQGYLWVITYQWWVLNFVIILICNFLKIKATLLFFESKSIFIIDVWFICKIWPILIKYFGFLILFHLHIIFFFILAIKTLITIKSTRHSQSKKIRPFFCIFNIKEIIILFDKTFKNGHIV